MATIVLAWLWSPLGWIGAILTVWVCYFFRDPAAGHARSGTGLVVSPADGRVNLITTAVPPAELDLPPEPMTRISVFMNVFDCHVNRSPVAGRIAQILYTPGLFLNAELDKASEDNERNALVIETAGTRSAWSRSRASWRAASSSFVKERRPLERRRALRPDPVRLAARHLPAAQRPGARRARPEGGRGRDGAGGSDANEPARQSGLRLDAACEPSEFALLPSPQTAQLSCPSRPICHQ